MFFHKKQLMAGGDSRRSQPPFCPIATRTVWRSNRRTHTALQYWVQSFHCEDAGIKDMLQDIALEEFSHLEMVGSTHRNAHQKR